MRGPFDIAPMLMREPRDEYARYLVSKIRAGQYVNDLWNCNGLYLAFPDHQALAEYQRSPAMAPRAPVALEIRPPRVRLTPEQREQRRIEREAKKAERARMQEYWEETRRQFLAEQQRRNREWQEQEQRDRATLEWRETEKAAILRGPWQCTVCNSKTPARVSCEESGSYLIECLTCGKMARGGHAELFEAVMARKALDARALL